MDILTLALAKQNGGSGGGSGVDVTASVGQTIVVEEVDANGKPTKWKAADFQAKICGSEVVEILPETTFEIDPDDGAAFLPELALEAGMEYTVNYNGTEYVLTCEELTPGSGVLALGNTPLILETGDNGVPFLIVLEEGEWVLGAFDGAETVTLSIFGIKHTPIPIEYLPNDLPYYIEMDYSWDSQKYVYTCYDTAENVKAVFDSGRLVRIKAKLVASNSMQVYGISTSFLDIDQLMVGNDGRWSFTFSVGNTVYMVTPQDDGSLLVEQYIG